MSRTRYVPVQYRYGTGTQGTGTVYFAGKTGKEAEDTEPGGISREHNTNISTVVPY
jgi:hypothetical protein